MINLKIANQNLLVSNLSLTEGQITARLISDVAAGSSSVLVNNINGFAAGNFYVLIGNFGDTNAEIIKMHASTAPTGSTLTLASAIAYDHYSDTVVTLLDYNQVEFSRATTLTGTKTVLATQSINSNREDSLYKDLTNTTGYAFARFKNAGSSAFSSYSVGLSYSGNGQTSVQKIVEKACRDTGVEVGGQYSTEEMLLDDINDCQDAVTDFDWKFELIKDTTSLTAVAYENTYDLSSLAYEMKYPGIMQGIKDLKLGTYDLDYIDNDEMNLNYANTAFTTLASQASANATSITLTSSYEFPESGTVYVGGFAIPYTANSQATGVLSGISSSVITSIIAAGSNVWWNASPGLSRKYTITVDNKILLDRPVDSVYAGYIFKFEYLKKLTRFTDFSSTTEVPFTDIMPLFIKSKIEERKRNSEKAKDYMTQFMQGIQVKLAFYKLPTMETTSYYNFFDAGRTSVLREEDR